MSKLNIREFTVTSKLITIRNKSLKSSLHLFKISAVNSVIYLDVSFVYLDQSTSM